MDIATLAGDMLGVINGVIVPVLFAVAFIVFIYGIFRTYIYHADTPAEVEKGHKIILWGLVGFVVMLSLWGLVNVLSNTFGLSGEYAPCPPTIWGTPCQTPSSGSRGVTTGSIPQVY